MIRVYTASKLSFAPEWEKLQEGWAEVFFHARWLHHVKVGTPDTEEYASSFWIEDAEDVAIADAVLVYGAEGDKLRGALVEAGMAIALDIPVILVGDHQDYGTWQHHPGVVKVSTFDNAYDYLSALSQRQRFRDAA